ncbi:hypothetical protein NVP1015O_05 [Vibrio phage 1.015.O._10N.222.51.E5]|nr:hypothetical protein NVP1015O_05 [Vibrio phage 1.015.O._10N.222.51.E5]
MATDDPKFLKGDSPSEEPGQHIPPEANPPTGGDMLKSVYDPGDTGKVNSAVSADQATLANNALTADKVNGIDGAGLSWYYGTDSVGSQGFHPLPALGGGAGVTAFTGLTDTPNSYAGSATYVLQVNGAETGLILVEKAPKSVEAESVEGANTAPVTHYYGTNDLGVVGFHLLPSVAASADDDARKLIWQGI